MRFDRWAGVALALFGGLAASIAGAQTIDEFPITTADSEPGGITVGPDGNLWFTEFGVGQIGRITTGGTVTEFTAAGNPQLIVVGSDGKLWFPETTVNRIGHMTTSGAFGDFPVINSDPSLVGIAAGSDGNLWFCEAGPGNVGRITTGGTVTEFPVSGFPLQITAGPDGNLWYGEYDSAAVGNITTSGVTHDFPTGIPGSTPQGITTGPDGNLWFTDTAVNQIGRMTTSGSVTEFPIPTADANLVAIAVGPDGNLWFDESHDNANKIGRITPKGVVTEFPVPTPGAGPGFLVAGPDGALWFTEVFANKIGRVQMSTLAADTASVDANAVSGSSSNANGVFEPGETVEVSPAWHNTAAGAQSVSGTAATLTGPAGPTYSIVDASASYGSIAGGATADCHDATGDCYLVTISGARPVAHWDAVLTETLNGSTTTWARTIHLGNSFADVPTTYPFYAYIENLFHSGATGGCGGGLYCPTGTVTRGQMAVFLLKGKYGAGFVPPACSGHFADVPCPSQFADWIEEFAAEGITAGCGGGDYCPSQPVTRAQMAVFLLKAEHGATYVPPACTGTFADVPCPSQYANWVEQLHAEGITAGCGGGNYCPNDPNIRGQMAVFLVKVFSLALYGA
jgi:virginiamycin B lyase